MDRHSKCTLGVQAPRVQIIKHRWRKITQIKNCLIYY